MNKISEYKSINLITYNKIYTFVTMLILIIIFILILSFNTKFDSIFSTKATFIKESETLKIIVNEEDLAKITDNNRLIIKFKKYEYKVKKIDKKILDSIPIQQYNEILLDLKLEDKYKIENNSLDIKITYDKRTGFEIIKDFILGKDW